MKKVLFTILLMPCLAFALITGPDSNTYDNTGALVKKDRVIVKVKNLSGSAMSKGWAVILHPTYDDGFSVTTATNEYDEPFCVTDEAIASAAVGDCVVWGYHDAVYVSIEGAQAAAGGKMYLAGSTSPGYVTAVALTSVAATSPVLGIFYDAKTASGTVEAFINLL